MVDDNHDAAEVLSEALELLGYETRVAYDALATLDTVAQFKPQVMLIDIGMPVMDGYELARRLRAMKELGHPKLIALTGFGQESDRALALEAGFDEHMVKPIDLEGLESLLKK
ncbi:MAG: response regulator [Candidatus Binatus sp.]|nr:response regulator [Candidatus Binatus sp.]